MTCRCAHIILGCYELLYGVFHHSILGFSLLEPIYLVGILAVSWITHIYQYGHTAYPYHESVMDSSI